MASDIDLYSNFLFYEGEDGKTNIRVFADPENETIWTTQKGMSDIFGVEVPAINKHLKNIYDSGELTSLATISKMEIVQSEGGREVKRLVDIYNLDAIISVGYRVNSAQATRFRIWATKVLKEYMIKGFALDDERLKQGGEMFGKDYFNELLERIREIRASERIFWKKITDIFAECSVDYDSKSQTAQVFYATVQNKMHWAIHKHTASELIYERADATKRHMGLTTWKGQGQGKKILRSDVNCGKNYLSEPELSEMNRVVSMYLDYAENMAKRQKVMTMTDWAKKLDDFLKFNDYEVLNNAGKISAARAKKKANGEYDKYRVIQDREYKSDFETFVEGLKNNKYTLPK